jgi:hypothetical protein
MEIRSITSNLIGAGLTIEEKWPINDRQNITWAGQSDISIALKNIPYVDKYAELNKAGNYNFKMLDGALVQLMYRYDNRGRKLLSHRLAFYPSPVLERYDENPEDYEAKFFSGSEYHDLVELNTVSCPIRFDFSSDDKYFVDVNHPYCHAHFGEYENCRIPLGNPLSPSLYVNFILRNFYNYSIKRKGDIIKRNPFLYDSTITANEKKVLHFNVL